jgi:hypothetical protein
MSSPIYLGQTLISVTRQSRSSQVWNRAQPSSVLGNACNAAEFLVSGKMLSSGFPTVVTQGCLIGGLRPNRNPRVTLFLSVM